MTSNQHPTAVVTGGGQGIGLAIARRLAHCGRYSLVAVIDRTDRESALRAEVGSVDCELLYVRGDVSVEEDVVAAAELIEARGPVGAVINNAAIFPRYSSMDVPFDEWMEVVRVNLGGAFVVSRTFARRMLEGGGGAIVNIASGRAFGGAVRGSHYSASKGGIVSLTRSLAMEWAPTIRVNAVVPGVTDTDQPRQAGITDEELYARGRNIPLGRIGQPDDTAQVVDMLLSEGAEFVTGQAWCVNGGAIMR